MVWRQNAIPTQEETCMAHVMLWICLRNSSWASYTCMNTDHIMSTACSRSLNILWATCSRSLIIPWAPCSWVLIILRALYRKRRVDIWVRRSRIRSLPGIDRVRNLLDPVPWSEGRVRLHWSGICPIRGGSSLRPWSTSAEQLDPTPPGRLGECSLRRAPGNSSAGSNGGWPGADLSSRKRGSRVTNVYYVLCIWKGADVRHSQIIYTCIHIHCTWVVHAIRQMEIMCHAWHAAFDREKVCAMCGIRQTDVLCEAWHSTDRCPMRGVAFDRQMSHARRSIRHKNMLHVW